MSESVRLPVHADTRKGRIMDLAARALRVHMLPAYVCTRPPQVTMEASYPDTTNTTSDELITLQFCTCSFSVVNCSNTIVPLNGELKGQSVKYDSVHVFTCNTGYQLEGSETRRCQENGSWGGAPTSCSSTFMFGAFEIYQNVSSNDAAFALLWSSLIIFAHWICSWGMHSHVYRCY